MGGLAPAVAARVDVVVGRVAVQVAEGGCEFLVFSVFAAAGQTATAGRLGTAPEEYDALHAS